MTILADEIHADFAYPGHDVTMFGTLGERYAGHCYEFTAPTKTFNIAGLLCSNVITVNPELKRAFDVAAENIAGLTVSHFGLVACQAAYERAEPWLDALMGVLADNLSLLREFAERTLDFGSSSRKARIWHGWTAAVLASVRPDELRDFMRDRARRISTRACCSARTEPDSSASTSPARRRCLSRCWTTSP